MPITLTSDRLKVDIALPGEEESTTYRFDRAGFITQVTLDGRHTFLIPEPPARGKPRGTGGAGLCSEYKCQATSEEAAVGERFLKPGVGLLLKETPEPYFYGSEYDCISLEVETTHTESSAVFKTLPAPCGGYALRTKKTVRVEKNILTMEITAENCGEKEMEIVEYCHNFLCIDQLPLSEGYRLDLTGVKPQDGNRPENPGSTIYGDGKGFSYSGPSPESSILYIHEDGFDRSEPFTWTLSHSMGPAKVREEPLFAPAYLQLWSIDSVISPEVQYAVTLAPGEEKSWTRRWHFED